MFLLAVTVYGEAFTADKGITFGFIWAGLMIFSADGLRTHRHNKKQIPTG